MSKRVRTLILTLTAAVLLVGLLLVLLFVVPEKKDSTSSTASSDTSVTIIDKTTDSSGAAVSQPVKKVSMKTKNEQFVLSPNKDGQIAVESYSDLLVNTVEINSLTKSLSKLTADKKIADSAENPADYGLDSPQAVLEVTYTDGSSAVFNVGNASPLKDGYYLQMKGDNAVYLVSTAAGEAFLQSSAKYIGTSVITAPTVKPGSTSDKAILRDMKLSGTVRADKPFAFRLRTDSDDKSLSLFSYVITSPVLTGFDSNKESMATATSLNAADVEKAHPTADDLKKYGLDTPYSVCEMSLAVQQNTKDNSSSAASSAPEYYNVAQHTVKLGGKDKSGNYYALIDSYNAVYLVSADSVPWAEFKYGDAVNKVLFYTNITDVASITVNAAGKETTYSLTHNPNETDKDKNLNVAVDGKTYSTPEFRNLYQVFMSVTRYGETDQKPSGSPDVTFTVRPNNSSAKQTVARFYKQNANLYLCSVEGGDTYTVKVSDVEKMLTEMNHYINGETVNS